MNVLLTGANGFLGSYLHRSIKSLDFTVYSRSKESIVDWKTIDGVVHCAGLAHNSHDKSFLKAYDEANVQLTRKLISSFLSSSAKFFVFISTCKVYDSIREAPELIEENYIGDNLSIYAQSKLQAEEELLKVQGKKIFILRPSVIVGPNPKGNIKTLEKLVEKKIPILIPSKSCTISLTDIRNLSQVINYLCLNHKLIKNGIYNINDNIRPDICGLLTKMATNKGKSVKLIRIPNGIYKTILELLAFIKPEISNKMLNLFFESPKISNLKISKIITLQYNSYE